MSLRAACVAVGVLSLIPVLANAQIITNWPVIAIGPGIPPLDCSNAPLHCQGAAYIELPGTFEAFVYPADNDLLSGCSFGFNYPSGWSIHSAELCAGTVVEGALHALRSGVRLAFSPCIEAETPVLHLIVNATSVGRLQFTNGPGGAFGSWDCSGQFHSYFGRPAFVDAGDICGESPLMHPCDFCTLHWGQYEPTATFTPPSLAMVVSHGQVGTAVLEVEPGRECRSIPECMQLPVPCYYGFFSQVEWLTFAQIGPQRYEARLDARALPPGIYYGGAEAEGAQCCQPVCWPVELTVVSTTAIGEPGVIPATWGQLKVIYE
jgi:hypothetical protein